MRRFLKKWFPHPFRIVGFLTILVAFYLIYQTGINWKFSNTQVLFSDAAENTAAYTYYAIGNDVLKCASDSAILATSDNMTKWKTNYSMSDPNVAVNDSIIAIYDKGGTSVCVCDEGGEIGSYNVEMPIVRATTTKTGLTALLLDDSEYYKIEYLDSNGGKISEIVPSIHENGYPLSLSISEDGMQLAVSYLKLDGSVLCSNVCFYDFGKTGASKDDNIVAEFTYENEVISDIAYLTGGRVVAFGTENIVLFGGGNAPELIKTIPTEGEMKSVFCDRERFGVIVEKETNRNKKDIKVYDKSGNNIMSAETDFVYTNVGMNGNRVVLNDRNEMCVYSLKGVEQYRGNLPKQIRQITYIGNNKFAFAADDEYTIITLI